MSTLKHPKRLAKQVESRIAKKAFYRNLNLKDVEVVKQCTKCKEWFPLDHFYVRGLNDHRPRAICITCFDKQVAENRSSKTKKTTKQESATPSLALFLHEDSTKMKMRLWSDIHNEFGALNWDRRDDDHETTLVIAGDYMVGDRGLDLLRTLCESFKYVVFTCGNHEYYHHAISEVNDALERFAVDQKNFFFLNPGCVYLDGVRFIGATLWTDLKDADPIVKSMARSAMNDFRYIKADAINPFNPDKWVEINEAHSAYIRARLVEPFDGKTVIVTHHAPLMQSVGKDKRFDNYRDRILNYAYGNTKLDDLFETGNFHYWFHGHVHIWQEYSVHGKIVRARPRGYIGYEATAAEYDRLHKDAEVFTI